MLKMGKCSNILIIIIFSNNLVNKRCGLASLLYTQGSVVWWHCSLFTVHLIASSAFSALDTVSYIEELNLVKRNWKHKQVVLQFRQFRVAILCFFIENGRMGSHFTTTVLDMHSSLSVSLINSILNSDIIKFYPFYQLICFSIDNWQLASLEHRLFWDLTDKMTKERGTKKCIHLSSYSEKY